MSSHAVNAFGWDLSAFFKSAGTSCTTPPEIFFCDTDELSGFGTLAVAKPYTLDRGNRVPVSVWTGKRKLLRSRLRNRQLQ
jgi:hypothetical protein